ncbi:unnamed protein product [Rhizophagus irregularis]|nr:unnamed protein product [Rhizophagus irregularis]
MKPTFFRSKLDEEADDNGEIQCLFWIDRFWVGSFCISSGCRKEFLDFWDIFICMMHNGHCTPIWIEDRIFNIIFERITINTLGFVERKELVLAKIGNIAREGKIKKSKR